MLLVVLMCLLVLSEATLKTNGEAAFTMESPTPTDKESSLASSSTSSFSATTASAEKKNSEESDEISNVSTTNRTVKPQKLPTTAPTTTKTTTRSGEDSSPGKSSTHKIKITMTSTSMQSEETTTPTPETHCFDQFSRCQAVRFLCKREIYKKEMVRSCAKTCEFCDAFVVLPENDRCKDTYSEMRSLVVLCALFSLAVADILPQLRKVQSTAVKGKLLCNGKPYEKARVKLYEKDPIIYSVKDTLMAEGLTTAEGTFLLKGNDKEWTKIDPKLNIYHNCEDEAVECWRKVQINIPDDFITEGENPAKTFDIGVLNLNAKLPGEGRDCLN